jgi:multiple sugar transport system permease protein
MSSVTALVYRHRPRRVVAAHDRPRLATIVLLVVGGIIFVAPFLWMFTTSMRPAASAYDLPPQWLPTSLNMDNYRAAFDSPVPLLRNAVDSLVVAVATTSGVLATSATAGYAFAKLRFPFRNILFVVLITQLMIPLQVTVIPLFAMLRQFGLINNLLSLILPATFSALGIFLLRQFFKSVPDEILEAARIDGANEWQVFWRVALPLAKPGLAALAVIAFLLSWNDYFAPLIFLTTVDTATLPLSLVTLLGPYRSGNPAVVMAATTLAVLPALIAFVVAQRWIVETLSRSGSKG